MKLDFKKDIANFFAEACVWDNSKPTRNYCQSLGKVLNFQLSADAMGGLDGNMFNLDIEHNGKATNIIGKFKVSDNKVMATFEAFGKTAELYKMVLTDELEFSISMNSEDYDIDGENIILNTITAPFVSITDKPANDGTGIINIITNFNKFKFMNEEEVKKLQEELAAKQAEIDALKAELEKLKGSAEGDAKAAEVVAEMSKKLDNLTADFSARKAELAVLMASGKASIDKADNLVKVDFAKDRKYIKMDFAASDTVTLTDAKGEQKQVFNLPKETFEVLGKLGANNVGALSNLKPIQSEDFVNEGQNGALQSAEGAAKTNSHPSFTETVRGIKTAYYKYTQSVQAELFGGRGLISLKNGISVLFRNYFINAVIAALVGLGKTLSQVATNLSITLPTWTAPTADDVLTAVASVVSSQGYGRMFFVYNPLDAAAINFDLTIENLAKKGIAIDFVASSITPGSFLAYGEGTTEVDYSDEMYDHLIASEGNKNIHELDMFFVANVNGAQQNAVIATTWANAITAITKA